MVVDMHDNLDKWIKSAREVTPDSGEYRRLNRVLVKERMITAAPGRKRHHPILIFSLALLMMVAFSGKISQLGSNSFETEKKIGLSAWGDTIIRHYNVFGGGSTNLPDSYTDADVRAFNQSLAAGEGEMTRVTGLSYGGKTSWIKHMRRDINGKVTETGQSTVNPVSEEPVDMVAFFIAHMGDLKGKMKSLPPQAEVTMTIDDVLVDFKVWTYEYPDYGKVTFYDGYPAEIQ
jgi:hypothetical protein